MDSEGRRPDIWSCCLGGCPGTCPVVGVQGHALCADVVACPSPTLSGSFPSPEEALSASEPLHVRHSLPAHLFIKSLPQRDLLLWTVWVSPLMQAGISPPCMLALLRDFKNNILLQVSPHSEAVSSTMQTFACLA